MSSEETIQYIADEIRAGRCPFGRLSEGQSMAHCPSGFPGCACADEWTCNPILSKELDSMYEQYVQELDSMHEQYLQEQEKIDKQEKSGESLLEDLC